MSLAIRCQEILYKDTFQSTLFQNIVTSYLRMLALSTIYGLRRYPLSSFMRGPWRLASYLSSTVVSIFSSHLPFGIVAY